jgi:hypothetical protein
VEGPLSPALSPLEGERENHRQVRGVVQVTDSSVGFTIHELSESFAARGGSGSFRLLRLVLHLSAEGVGLSAGDGVHGIPDFGIHPGHYCRQAKFFEVGKRETFREFDDESDAVVA